MSIYWAIGHVVALRWGYYDAIRSSLTHSASTAALASRVAVVVVTLLCQRQLNKRFSNYGRSRSALVSLLFGVANGCFESFCFLGAYDTKLLFGSNHWMVGAAVYYVYAGAIHVFFWLPMCFPKHTRPDAPNFFPSGLSYLTIISICWFVLYAKHGDILGFCLSHILIDVWVAWNIGLEGPILQVQ